MNLFVLWKCECVAVFAQLLFVAYFTPATVKESNNVKKYRSVHSVCAVKFSMAVGKFKTQFMFIFFSAKPFSLLCAIKCADKMRVISVLSALKLFVNTML